MRIPHATTRRNLTAAVYAAAIFFDSATAQAQDASEGGENLLVLSRMCGAEYADTPSLSQCLQSQNEKADRWLQSVVESYVGWAAREMEVRRQYGGNPIDQVAQLRRSQAAFDMYRKESAELVRQSIDGSIAKFEAAKAHFELTIGRARFLLGTCGSRFNWKQADKVDLTVANWCWPGPK